MLRDTSSEASALSSEGLQSLKAWLQSDDGFDDQVVRRCKRGNAIGLLLFGEGDEVPSAEVAIDLACNSVALITGEGSSRRQTDAFFDPSRAQILELLGVEAPRLLRRNE